MQHVRSFFKALGQTVTAFLGLVALAEIFHFVAMPLYRVIVAHWMATVVTVVTVAVLAVINHRFKERIWLGWRYRLVHFPGRVAKLIFEDKLWCPVAWCLIASAVVGSYLWGAYAMFASYLAHYGRVRRSLVAVFGILSLSAIVVVARAVYDWVRALRQRRKDRQTEATWSAECTAVAEMIQRIFLLAVDPASFNNDFGKPVFSMLQYAYRGWFQGRILEFNNRVGRARQCHASALKKGEKPFRDQQKRADSAALLVSTHAELCGALIALNEAVTLAEQLFPGTQGNFSQGFMDRVEEGKHLRAVTATSAIRIAS